MSKSQSTKSKPPWIPAGIGQLQHKKSTKPVSILKNKKDDRTFNVLPEWSIVDISKKEASPDLDADVNMSSSSSQLSYEFERQATESDVNYRSLLNETALFYEHFKTIKASYLSAQRLISCQDIEDRNITEIFVEVGTFLKTLNALFEDLDYQISVFDNTLNENQRTVELASALKKRKELLSTLLAMYEKVILIFQIIFDKQDFKELSKAQEFLREKQEILEKRCVSQSAINTDLERKLSIYQSKIAAMESYKANLEKDNAQLQKNLLLKEYEIEYLKKLLMNAPKPGILDEQKFMEIIEEMKTEVDNEKADKLKLKNAVKIFKACKEKEKKEADENYNKLLKEKIEQERMNYDLAAQRDQLKVQLTVVNNTVVQLRHELEVNKILNRKLHDEMVEIESSHKKEVAWLKSTIDEKSIELDETLKRKKSLENTEICNNQKKILALAHEIKQYILELKYQPLLFGETDMSDPKSPKMKKDLEKQLKKTEHLYKTAVKENESLKQKLEDLRSLASASSARNNDDYSSADKSTDHRIRNLQLEVYKKDKEIANLKYDLAHCEKDLENNLKESKEKLRNLEMQNAKIEELEKELKNTKYELSFVQRKKEEETSSLLQRAQELQESLANKTAECKNLEEHIQRLKTHYYRVFENS